MDANVGKDDAYVVAIDAVLDWWMMLVGEKVLARPAFADAIESITQVAKKVNELRERAASPLLRRRQKDVTPPDVFVLTLSPNWPQYAIARSR